MKSNDPRPEDLISIKEAARIMPSPYGGRLHMNTVRRWALAGRLRYWRNGPWIFVSRAELLDLAVENSSSPPPRRKPGPKPTVAQRAFEEECDATLRKYGLKR